MQDGIGRHSFGVTGALPLGTAWQRVLAALHAGQVQLAEKAAPPLMKAFFRAAYPPASWAGTLRLQMQIEDAAQKMIGAFKSGELPLWIAPIEGPHSERQLSADSLGELNKRSLTGGRYLPFNDREHMAYGYPLFVKQHDWERFFSGLQPGAAHIAATVGAESECQDWLKKQFANDPQKKRAKAYFKKEALVKFGKRLSGRGFCRAWAAVAPEEGRSTSGRKS